MQSRCWIPAQKSAGNCRNHSRQGDTARGNTQMALGAQQVRTSRPEGMGMVHSQLNEREGDSQQDSMGTLGSVLTKSQFQHLLLES